MDIEELLKWPSVRCNDPENVKKKLAAIKDGGTNKLMVISDFDYTLSRSMDVDGSKCWTTHSVFDHEAEPQLGVKLRALSAKYMPMEFDPDIKMEDKIPGMLDWWSTAHDLISEAGFDKQTLQKFTRESKLKLRDLTKELLTSLHEKSVPLVLFSAGVGDLIEIFLKQQMGELKSNIHLISNMIKFDAQDKVVGFKDPLIHTFNKNSSVIEKERTFFHELAGRSNVVLLGDSLGDIHMDVGVEKESVVLKIGFLNFNIDKLMPEYLRNYDVVLVEDMSMHVPLQIINSCD